MSPVTPGTARNHRIRIEQSTEAADTHGEPIPTWGVFAVVWAAVTPLMGQERYSAQQVHADVSHRITVDYLAGVTPKMRALWQGRVFDFTAVINVGEQNRELQILAVERV